jgi:cytochrome c oxidase cbb3-type subunit I/II
LLTADLKFSAIQPLVAASSFLGAVYGEAEMTDAEGHARKQAERVAADIVKQGGPAGVQEKQAIALIAYLQRMGTDLFRTEEPAKKADAGAVPATDVPPAETPTAEPPVTTAAAK